MPEQLYWLIFLLPLAASILIFLMAAPFKARPRLFGYIGILAVAASAALSLWALSDLLSTGSREILIPGFEWLAIGDSFRITFGLIMDSLTAVMVIVISLVSLMVQIYSQGYMHGDPGYYRYYGLISLFTASMLGLVLTDNLFMAFAFWELVGLCSYLLIGFWFERPAAASAAKKAFIVTRIGDIGFLAAILLLFAETGSLNITEVNHLAATGIIAGGTLTAAALLIFTGAVGKSAQFPLHIWLPDAMEGPTPVSALIHAATMVAAGVFLVARTFPIFEASESALLVVAIIGGFTALFAATMGLVMTDIKRVLAYSTISQLGYMMLALGTGSVAIAIFHLFNHAFIKSLLFLGAGSVNHATGTFDMNHMGGLRRVMPWTFITFLVASLSMAGIWPLSGFWSKDEILAGALDSNAILFWLAMITVFMTAFYMFRIIFVTFGGKYRGLGHPHESPRVMLWPLLFLGVLAAFSGLVNVTGGFGHFLGHGETTGFLEGFFSVFGHPLTWLSLAFATGGILLAYAMYSARWLDPAFIRQLFRPLHFIFSRKYLMDELFEKAIAQVLLLKGAFAGLQFFDSRIWDNGLNSVIVENAIVRRLFAGFRYFDEKGVDKAVDGVAGGTRWSGRILSKAQTGQLQVYALFIAGGILAILLFVYLAG